MMEPLFLLGYLWMTQSWGNDDARRRRDRDDAERKRKRTAADRARSASSPTMQQRYSGGAVFDGPDPRLGTLPRTIQE